MLNSEANVHTLSGKQDGEQERRQAQLAAGIDPAVYAQAARHERAQAAALAPRLEARGYELDRQLEQARARLGAVAPEAPRAQLPLQPEVDPAPLHP